MATQRQQTIPHWAVRLACRYPASGRTFDPQRSVYATSGGIEYFRSTTNAVAKCHLRNVVQLVKG
jgi:hypothetical protein